MTMELPSCWRRSLSSALRACIAMLCVFNGLVSPGPASAVPGDLVSEFGTGGLVTTDPTTLDDGIAGLAILPDGKIIAGGNSSDDIENGEFVLARYNSDGSLDTTFGTSGIARIDFGVGLSELADIAVQTDGKIVAAGKYADMLDGAPVFALARFCPDGAADTGVNCPTLQPKFGASGKVMTEAIAGSLASYAQAVVVQSDGKIVAGGAAVSSGADYDAEVFALVRYNADGSLDTAFDGDGRVTTAMGAFRDEIYDLAIDATNKIVGVGVSVDADYYQHFALARYTSSGSLDASFDGDGKVITALAAEGFAYALAIQPGDGKLVTAGYATTDLDTYPTGFAVARYNPNGSLDTGFGTGGSTILFFHPEVLYDFANSVALDTYGRILVGGLSFPSANGAENAALARLCPDGTLDTGGKCSPYGFSEDGRVTLPGSGASSFHALAVRPADGNILAGGSTEIAGSRVFRMALFEGGLAGAFAISGNAGVGGATLSYTDGTPQTATADSSGDYTFGVSSGWSGTVTPSKTGYTFTQPSRSYSNVLAHQTGQDYTAAAITYTITGNAGTSGAVLMYTDGTPKTAISGSNGEYSITVSYNWSGTVMPTKIGYDFDPASLPYTNVLAHQTAQNYQAILNPPVIAQASGVSHNRFTAHWTAGAPDISYRLDVATDPDFTHFVPGYQALNVGNGASYTVTGLSANTPYYYRLRATSGEDTSLPSGVAQVLTWRAVFLPVVIR